MKWKRLRQEYYPMLFIWTKLYNAITCALKRGERDWIQTRRKRLVMKGGDWSDRAKRSWIRLHHPRGSSRISSWDRPHPEVHQEGREPLPEIRATLGIDFGYIRSFLSTWLLFCFLASFPVIITLTIEEHKLVLPADSQCKGPTPWLWFTCILKPPEEELENCLSRSWNSWRTERQNVCLSTWKLSGSST